MPIIPKYENSVSTAPKPVVESRVNAPIEAFGGGQQVQQLTETASQGFELAGKLYANELRKADDVINDSLESELMKENERIRIALESDPKYQGENAKDARKYAEEEWKNSLSKIQPKASTAYQKSTLDENVKKYTSDLNKKVTTHTITEMEKFEVAKYKDNVATFRAYGINNAIKPDGTVDQDAVDASINKQRMSIVKFNENRGLPSEAQQLEAVSKTHTGVTNRLMNSGKDLEAKEYYTKFSKQFTPEDKAAIEKSLEIAERYGFSQREVDKYMAEKKGFSEMLDEAGLITDPNKRRDVEDRIIKLQSAAKTAKEMKEETSFKAAFDQVNKTGSIRSVPPSVMADLPPDKQNALVNIAKGVNDPYGIRTNKVLYNKYMAMPVEELKALKPSDVLSLKGSFRKEDYDNFEQRYEKAKNPEKAPEVGEQIADNDRILGAMRDRKIVKKNDKLSTLKGDSLKSFEKARSEIEVEYGRWAKAHGKKEPPPEEKNRITNEVLSKTVYVDGFFSDSEKPIVSLTDSEKRKAYVPFDKIPEDKRLKLYGKARQNGWITDGTSKKEADSRISKAYGRGIIGASEEDIIKALKGE